MGDFNLKKYFEFCSGFSYRLSIRTFPGRLFKTERLFFNFRQKTIPNEAGAFDDIVSFLCTVFKQNISEVLAWWRLKICSRQRKTTICWKIWRYSVKLGFLLNICKSFIIRYIYLEAKHSCDQVETRDLRHKIWDIVCSIEHSIEKYFKSYL